MDGNRVGDAGRTHDESDPTEEAACIAHDLKNPLGAIRMVASLLRERFQQRDSELAQAIQIIERNVAYMDRLIHEAEDVSRLEHGCLQLHYEPVDLIRLLANVQRRSALDTSRIWMQVTADAPVKIVADAIRIERVLVNLIDNALKHSSTTVIVRVERRSECVRVAVCDQGPGVSPDDSGAIFEMHRRLHAALSLDGAGLGLYISRRIVEAHGGTIGVESMPRQGACFYVELPIQPWVTTTISDPVSAP